MALSPKASLTVSFLSSKARLFNLKVGTLSLGSFTSYFFLAALPVTVVASFLASLGSTTWNPTAVVAGFNFSTFSYLLTSSVPSKSNTYFLGPVSPLSGLGIF